jgi:hypothetical protein
MARKTGENVPRQLGDHADLELFQIRTVRLVEVDAFIRFNLAFNLNGGSLERSSETAPDHRP